ncbi:MAG: MarR family winged helix-turn-helix transcriptional regulator [Elsteraceae bacterium]
MNEHDRNVLSFETALQVGQTCLGLRVQTAARILGRRYDEALRPVGLTGWQYSLMMTLNRPHPLTISGLAEALAMDRTTITANLKPLERRGLVETLADPNDARIRRIRLSAEGESLLAEALPRWRAVNDAILDRLSDGEREALRTAFGVLLQSSPEGRGAHFFLPSSPEQEIR